MRTKEINSMKLEIPAKSCNESFARTAVASWAAQLDPTLDEINDIKTAVSEAVTNAIVHAYPETLGTIYISSKILENNELVITVKDKGIGIVNIERAKEPMYTTGGEERSGMGFTIMESFMDGLKVRSREGVGTTVTMRKKIAYRGKSVK